MGSKASARLAVFAAFAAMGLTPIVALALSLIEVLPLRIGGPALVGSAALAGVALGRSAPGAGTLALRGLAAGVVAVFVYDCTRWPFVLVGGWPDFIPNIGAWLLDRPSAHWSVGYLWRYAGNGGGMGLTFAMMTAYTDPWVRRRLAGPLYGVAIWCGLMLTLIVAPEGQEKMFPITPATVAVTLTGHLVYGTVLGLGVPLYSMVSSSTRLGAGPTWLVRSRAPAAADRRRDRRLRPDRCCRAGTGSSRPW